MLDHREHDTPRTGAPRPDAWLAVGFSGIVAGTWLLRVGDPYLLTMWGVAFLILGAVSVVVATGMLLRIWE